jgi:predicted DsbA family dithiol-disulfide isomerase
MKIEIWSDVVCPFCYIGKRKFEEALSAFKYKDEVEVIWHSFQLAPDAEYVPGKTLNQMLSERKGISLEKANEMNEYVANVAAEVGLEFNLDKAIPVNTFDAHRLIHLAAKYNLQSKMKERLLHAYFTKGLNVSDHGTLLQLGKEAGLDETEVRAMLVSDAMANEVKADIQEANALQIQGVPFFVFNRKYAISGAQSPETFFTGLEKAWTEWKKENLLVNIPSAGGDTCTPGEPC